MPLSATHPPTLDYAPQPPRGALLAIFLVVLVDMLGFGLVIPLLPIYARIFQASPLQVTLLFSLYSICQFFGAPLLGMLSDRVGRRPVLFFSQTLTCLGYILLAWATSHQWQNPQLGLGMIYLSRIIAGLGGGNISTAQAYISDVTTSENRTRGMGMLGAAFGIGFSIGPAAGGMLSHYFNPATPAWVAMGMGGISAILAGILVRDVARKGTTQTVAWLHPSRFKPLFANRPLMRVNLVWFLSMGAFVAMDSVIVMFLLDIFGYDDKHIAWYFLLVGGTIIITQGRLIGRLNARFGEWALCITGLGLAAIGSMLTAGTYWHAAVWLLVLGAIINAFGRSLFQPTISALVSHHSDPQQQGLSYGFFQGVGTLSRALSPLGAGFMYARLHSSPWIIGSLCLAATGLGLVVIRSSETLPTANLLKNRET